MGALNEPQTSSVHDNIITFLKLGFQSVSQLVRVYVLYVWQKQFEC